MNFADVFALVAEWWASDFLSIELTFGSVTFSIKSLVIWACLAGIVILSVRRLQS